MGVIYKDYKYKSFRIDLKRAKEFRNENEVMHFFKVAKSTVGTRSSGAGGSHVIGFNIRQRWLIFKASHEDKYVQSVLKKCKSKNIKFKNNRKRQN